MLDRIILEQGRPAAIRVDIGPEFSGKTLDAWAYHRGVALSFITPSRPIENAFVESFKGKFRDECFCQHWFRDLDDARPIIADWRDDCNTFRPHSALGNLPPAVFAHHFMSHQRLSE